MRGARHSGRRPVAPARPLVRRLLILLAVAGALLPVSVSAHPYLVGALPAAGSTVPESPAQIVISYTEPLDAPFCSVSLVAPDGAEVHTTVTASGSLLTATPPALAAGTYVVHWSAVGADGHRVLGDFAFNVVHASPNPAASALGVDYTSTAGTGVVEDIGRGALTVTTIVLAGLLLLGGLAVTGDEAARAVAARRLRRVLRGAWTAQLAVVLALVALLVRWNGIGALLPSVTGQLVVLRGLLTVAAAPAVVGGPGTGEASRPWRRVHVYGALMAAALLGALTLSGHALARGDGRTLDLAVLGVHLAAVSVWVGALIALVAGGLRIGDGVPGGRLAAEARRLAPVVAVSLSVLVLTGLYNAHVNLRGLDGLATTAYGRVLDVKVGLVVATVALGVVAAWRRAHLEAGPRTPGRRLVAVEAAGAVAVVGIAGALAQVPDPASLPFPSQVAPRDAGTLFLAASNGRHLVSLAVSPGVAGTNRVIAAVQRTDDNDMTVPAEGTDAVDLTASCACAHGPVHTRLAPRPGGGWWTADVALPAGRWTFSVQPRVGGVVEPFADAAGDITAATGADAAVVGVAADLSGTDGQACQDRVVGLQAAAVEANVAAVANGAPVRVVAVDTAAHGPEAAVASLASLGAGLLAEPCGDQATVAAVEAAAQRHRIPVLGDAAAPSPGVRVLDTGIPSGQEAAALADQVVAQHASDVTVLVGGDRVDVVETSDLTTRLATLRIRTRVLPIIGVDATTLAAHVRALAPQCVVFVAGPDTALPLIQAFGALQPEWSPTHAAIASARLMSNRLAADAGDWVTFGRVSFASEIDPDDVPGIRYASDLGEWFGGRRPTIDGARGYVAGWLAANAFRNAADIHDPASVLTSLHTHFADFSLGQSYHLDWTATGSGGADRIAFYTTVFTNPLTLIGAPTATNHAGIFLKTGAYVRVTPYRTTAIQE